MIRTIRYVDVINLNLSTFLSFTVFLQRLVVRPVLRPVLLG